MTTLSQLFDLPQQITDSSFVVNLADADGSLDQLVDQYVITEQLAQSFGQALHLIREAVDNDDAVASYLHGSFGSGKSHFMAVLYGLLQRHPAALSKAGLEGVVQEFNPWLRDKSFLLVPFHMIGATSIEQKLLGGYVDHITRLHPDKRRSPWCTRARQALRRCRPKMRAYAGRRGRSSRSSTKARRTTTGATATTGATTTAGMLRPTRRPPTPRRRIPTACSLLNALIDTFFQSYSGVVGDRGEAYVDLDLGCRSSPSTPSAWATTRWSCSSTRSSCGWPAT